ncbi:MAG TPA: Gldg family protein [Chthoniobacteraceae bacterium]|jgi:ABC-type uncharacterized transport system involved in gliding motility auxiliary subunit|nr:Gldg family protein [Chthoniobacteraceae bacterium]
MATNSTDTKKAPRIHRVAIGTNVLVQILTLLFILAGINYYAFKHFKRWDFSLDQTTRLSDQTKQILAHLQKPLKIYEFFSPDPRLPGGDIFSYLQSLLKEYQYAAPQGMVDVETIDPFKDLGRAKELMTKYKFGNENVVIIDYQGHSKVVNAADMAEYDNSGEMTGQPPQLKGFKGEQALTSAILEVTEPHQNKIYLIGGKGGPELNSDDLSAFKAYMQRQNLLMDTTVLMNDTTIPDDAKAVMLIGAKYDLTDRELKLLQDYWGKDGRIFVALDPSGHTPKLDAFLASAGIKPQDDRVLRTMSMGPITGIVRDVASNFSESSPITKDLKGVDTIFPGQTQSLALTQLPDVRTDPLAIASQGYWGETKYQDMETTGVAYDPKEDINAPLTVAASAEKGALPDASVQMDTARMIVTGNADFLTNAALTEANVDFVIDGLNWLLNRKDLIGIPPKGIQQFSLNLTDDEMHKMELLVLLVMPAVVAMIGFGVWIQRRR